MRPSQETTTTLSPSLTSSDAPSPSSPNSRPHSHSNSSQTSGALLDPFRPEAPDERSYRLTARANEFFQKRNYKDAVAEYTRALGVVQVLPGMQQSDFSALLFSNRSASYFAMRCYEEAQKDADQVIRIRPEWAKGYFRRAEALMQLSRVEEAVSHYRKALDLDPDNPDIQNRLGRALIHKDNAAQGFLIAQLLPGRDIAVDRSINPIQNRIFEYAEMMRNLIYIVADIESRECVVIDACWDVEGIMKWIQQMDLKVVACAATHYHFDHVGGTPPPPYDSIPVKVSGLAVLLKKFPYIKAFIHPEDIPYVHASNPSIPAHRLVPTCTPTTTELRLGRTTTLRFMHAPGHTPGSQVIFVNETRMISGDVLLGGICGRTDLPGGSKEQMAHTLKKVLGDLDDKIVVLPGHDYGYDWSTIGIEREKGCIGEDMVFAFDQGKDVEKGNEGEES
ncbi:uncharacterized protein VTP21DRAFT_10532 [Calcarisporiella thermophila]|uniref:uncharacterized protein n=1 Tax=Calcarisporiella thermophila TaxID=911321 RepID=UPI0037433E96